MGSICEALKKGDRFPLDLLLCHYEDVAEFWDWWWENQADSMVLSRPYTVSDEDPILQETLHKGEADTVSNSEYFGEFLSTAIKYGVITADKRLDRKQFRMEVVAWLAHRAHQHEEPVVVFAGGGYGAGKTTTLSFLADKSCLPVQTGSLLGVDYCKLHIPEFNILRMLADGNASTICQPESRMISEILYEHLIENRLSFAWDSSMSNLEESMGKINLARKNGYRLELVAVWTPPDIATCRAMSRAKESRRFAHPDYLEPSARKFAQHFPEYVEVFDVVHVFYNGNVAQPLLIGKKDSVEFSLESYEDQYISEFVQYGKQT